MEEALNPSSDRLLDDDDDDDDDSEHTVRAEIHTGFHVKCPLLLSDFNQNELAE